MGAFSDRVIARYIPSPFLPSQELNEFRLNQRSSFVSLSLRENLAPSEMKFISARLFLDRAADEMINFRLRFLGRLRLEGPFSDRKSSLSERPRPKQFLIAWISSEHAAPHSRHAVLSTTIRFMFSYAKVTRRSCENVERATTNARRPYICICRVDLVASTIVVLDIMVLKIYTSRWLHTNGLEPLFLCSLSPHFAAR